MSREANRLCKQAKALCSSLDSVQSCGSSKSLEIELLGLTLQKKAEVMCCKVMPVGSRTMAETKHLQVNDSPPQRTLPPCIRTTVVARPGAMHPGGCFPLRAMILAIEAQVTINSSELEGHLPRDKRPLTQRSECPKVKGLTSPMQKKRG